MFSLLMSNDWKKVYISDKPHLIEIVKTMLEKNDIESAEIDKRDSSYISIGDIELYVKEKNVTIAKFLIDEWEKNL